MAKETLILIVAASAVAFPLVLGAATGRIPKEILLRWAFPLAGFTFFLAFGVRWVGAHVPAPWDFVVTSVFGAACLILGAHATFFGFRPSDAQSPPPRMKRAVGILLAVFGLLWLAIGLVRFLRA